MENGKCLYLHKNSFQLTMDRQECLSLLFAVANQVRKHPVSARHAAAQLPVPNHARIDIVSLAVFCDQQTAR